MADYTITFDRFDVMVRLGIHPHEAEPQRVRLKIALTIDYGGRVDADRIDQVLDYDTVRSGLHDMVEDRRFALQETLCEAIADLCLADPRVVRVDVQSKKLDVYPDARVGCAIVRRRVGST